jgi:predicted membrane chloride channel (bestrophin family)
MIVRDRPHGAQFFFVIRGSMLPHMTGKLATLATCTGVALLVKLTHSAAAARLFKQLAEGARPC